MWAKRLRQPMCGSSESQFISHNNEANFFFYMSVNSDDMIILNNQDLHFGDSHIRTKLSFPKYGECERQHLGSVPEGTIVALCFPLGLGRIYGFYGHILQLLFVGHLLQVHILIGKKLILLKFFKYQNEVYSISIQYKPEFAQKVPYTILIPFLFSSKLYKLDPKFL